MFSLVVPLYRSEPNLPRLFLELAQLAPQVPMRFEVVFVNDGSPDRCAEILAAQAPHLPYECQVLHLSRNFGAFAAIAAGLRYCRGEYMAVLAADLQEPPALALEFLRILAAGEADVVFGSRAERGDPLLTTLTSNLFWWTYRRFVNRDIPPGGIDVFGCNRQVRDHLNTLQETDTNLIALLVWLGFRRRFVTYPRQARREGISAWTFGKKLRYSLDSIFNFTDLPIRVLLLIGLIGTVGSITLSVVAITARLLGAITVPGYTPVILAIFLFGGLTTLGLGIVAQYLWLTLQNARRRPSYIVREQAVHEPRPQASHQQRG